MDLKDKDSDQVADVQLAKPKDPEVKMWLKMMVLGLLIFQTSAYVITARYSRRNMDEKYSSASVVLMTEVGKIILSSTGIIMGWGVSDLHGKFTSFVAKVVYLIRTSWRCSVVAGIFFVQNTLAYVALSYIPGSVYIVCNQFKIFTTALFSVLIMRRSLSWGKWRAMLLLVHGEILVQSHALETTAATAGAEEINNMFLGFMAALGQVTLSGLAGVYFEKVLKTQTGSGETLSVWDRNFQLAFWSIVMGGISVTIRYIGLDPGDPSAAFFYDWSIYPWLLVILMSVGGLLNGFAAFYTNAILKSFATAISVVMVSICGWFLGDILDHYFVLGAGVSLIAVFNYIG